MAKKSLIIFLLCLCAFVVVLSSAWRLSGISKFSKTKTIPLDITQVDSIVVDPGFKLSETKTNQFVADWNKARPNGPTKYIPLYLMTVYLKNGTHRTFRGNGGLLKEKTDEAFRMGEKDYFEKLTANPGH